MTNLNRRVIMQQAIHKYKLEIEFNKVLNVRMPDGAKILTVQAQNEEVCIWAINPQVNAIVPHYSMKQFRMYGTGHDHDKIEGTYLGTVQLANGSLVLHIFQTLV
jgi:hypothetical protein